MKPRKGSIVVSLAVIVWTVSLRAQDQQDRGMQVYQEMKEREGRAASRLVDPCETETLVIRRWEWEVLQAPIALHTLSNQKEFRPCKYIGASPFSIDPLAMLHTGDLYDDTDYFFWYFECESVEEPTVLLRSQLVRAALHFTIPDVHSSAHCLVFLAGNQRRFVTFETTSTGSVSGPLVSVSKPTPSAERREKLAGLYGERRAVRKRWRDLCRSIAAGDSDKIREIMSEKQRIEVRLTELAKVLDGAAPDYPFTSSGLCPGPLPRTRSETELSELLDKAAMQGEDTKHGTGDK